MRSFYLTRCWGQIVFSFYVLRFLYVPLKAMRATDCEAVIAWRSLWAPTFGRCFYAWTPSKYIIWTLSHPRNNQSLSYHLSHGSFTLIAAQTSNGQVGYSSAILLADIEALSLQVVVDALCKPLYILLTQTNLNFLAYLLAHWLSILQSMFHRYLNLACISF